MDRTHHDDRDALLLAARRWPGAGGDVGECLQRELMEEAALEIEVGRLLYVSENLYVESGDYRHELILYRLAADRAAARTARPAIRACTSGTGPASSPGRCCRRRSAVELAVDLADGFRRPIQHLVTVARPPG